MSQLNPCMPDVRNIYYTLLYSSTYDQLILKHYATVTGPHTVAPTAGPATPASENPAQPATPSATPLGTVVPAIPPAKDTAPELAVTETLAPNPPAAAAAAAAARSHSSLPAAAGTPTQATASSPPDTVVPAAERLPEAHPAATPRPPWTGSSSASAP